MMDSVNFIDKSKPRIKPLFAQLIKDRVVVHNKNAMVLVVGATGSGKSYGALRLAEILDPPDPVTGYEGFTIKRCVFDTEKFLELMKDGLDNNTLRKGSVIIYDEMGIGHSNRNFYDSLNKALNFVFQGFRRENLIVFMTVPKLKFVDLQLRELMHYIIVPKKIDFKRNVLWCKGYIVHQDPMNRDNTPFMIWKAKVGSLDFDGVRDLEHWGVGMPSEKLRIAYEEKKKKFMFELYDQAKALAKQIKGERIKEVGKRAGLGEFTDENMGDKEPVVNPADQGANIQSEKIVLD